MGWGFFIISEEDIMSLKSLTYPTTNKISINGGNVDVEDDLIQIDRNDDFVSGIEASLWTETLDDFTRVDGDPNELNYDASASSASYELESQWTTDGAVLCFQFGYEFNETVEAANTIIELRGNSGGSEYLHVSVNRNDTTSTYQLEIDWLDSDGTTDTKQVDFDYNEATLRVYILSGQLVVCHLTNDGWERLYWHVNFNYGWSGSWSLASSIANHASNSGTIYYKPFKSLPVIDGIFCDAPSTRPEMSTYGVGRSIFRVKPGYPGDFDVTLHGSGTNMGSSASYSIKVIHEKSIEDSFKFITSPVENLYDNATYGLLCKNFAEPHELFNRSNIPVSMKCVDDGTPQDESEVNVYIRRTGDFDKSLDKTPTFQIYDEDNGFKYGENFRFDRLFYTDNSAYAMSNPIRYIRCLELDNGDRFFYGVVQPNASALSSQNIYINADADPGSGTWNLYLINTDGSESLIDSGSWPGNPSISGLAPGRYRFDPGGVNQFDGDIHLGTDANGPVLESTSLDTSDSTQNDVLVTDMYFQIKEYRGHWGFWHWSRADNTLTPFEDVGNDEVSLRNNSISAIDIGDGKVAVLYEYMPTDGWMDNYATGISYKVYDLNVQTLSSRYTISFPRNISTNANYYWDETRYYVHAFDAVKTEDGIDIVFSARLRTKSFKDIAYDGTYVDIDVDFTPVISDGVHVLSVSDEFLKFDEEHYFITHYSAFYTRKELTSHKRFFIYRSPTYSTTEYSVFRSEPDSVKLEYDKDRDLSVLTVVDWIRRCPMVLAGRDTNWDEVMLPMFFDMAEYFGEVDGESMSSRDYFGVESCHCVWGYDGLIYGIGTRFDNDGYDVELATIDPELYFSNRKYFLDYGDGSFTGGGSQDFDIFEPTFKFECIPFFNTYNSTEGVEMASISRCNQYHIVGFGADFLTYPTLFQGNDYDRMPFETPEEELWIPEFKDTVNDQFAENRSLGNFTYNNEYLEITEHGQASPGFSWFSRTLNAGDTPTDFGEARYEMGDTGYKFHVRAMFASNSGFALPSRPQLFEAAAYYPQTATVDRQARVRFRAWNGDLDCQYWDTDLDTWATCHTFTDYLTEPEIVDYFILIQIIDDVGVPKYKVTFAYKRKNQAVTGFSADFLVDDDEFGFYSDSFECRSGSSTYFRVGVPDYDTDFFADAGNLCRVYQVGWNVLKARTGVLYETTNPLDPGTTIYVNAGVGDKRFRNFDDSIVLDYTGGDPDYFFKTTTVDRERRTIWYHYPNGWEFSLANGAAYFGDQWILKRDRLYNRTYGADTLVSKRLYGVWNTQNDVGDVTVWADAQDSGLEKFYVDTFLFDGANVRFYEIVGRDSSEDSWTVIDTIDLAKYKMDDIDTIVSWSDGDFKQLLIWNDAEFHKGEFEEFDYYLSGPDYNDSLKDRVVTTIQDSVDKQLFVKGINSTSNYSTVVSSRWCHKLNNPVRYRYIGFRTKSAANNATPHEQFRMKSFDFGLSVDIPLQYNHVLDSGGSFEAESFINYVYDEQAFSVKKKKISKGFSLEYAITDSLTYAKIRSMISKLTLNRKPVWVVENQKVTKDKFYLCFIQSTADHGPVIDDDGEKYYAITLELRSVK